MCGIHEEKNNRKVSFGPFSGAPEVMSPKILQSHSFPTSYLSAKFCRDSSSFARDACENVFYNHYNIDLKSVGFLLLTIKYHIHVLVISYINCPTASITRYYSDCVFLR